MSKRKDLFKIIVAALIGVVVSYGAIAFRWLIGFFQTVAFEHLYSLISVVIGHAAIILIPVIGGLITGPLIYKFARETKGHGVPEVLEAVALKNGIIRPVVVFFKALVSSITIGFGGSVGREGPIVQIGSAIGSSVGQFLKVSRSDMKNYVACGAAAGVAATFNAPIAGVFFALEVILRQFTTWSFSSIVVASVSASVISRIHLGNIPAFTIPPYAIVSYFELLAYLVLGVSAAFIALMYVRSIYFFEDLFEKIKVVPEWSKTAIGGVLIGGIGFYLPQVFGVGYESMEKALNNELSLAILFVLLVFKVIATSITVGSGGSGGVFAPALFVGAMFGGIIGNIVNIFSPQYSAPSGAYAIVGMGAVFAAAAQAPISAVLILFEMTGDYKIILPLMLSIGISTVIFGYLSRTNIYTEKLMRRGIDIDGAVNPNIFETFRVEKAMTRDMITVTPDMSIKDLRKLILDTRHKGFPVVTEVGELLGIVTSRDLQNMQNQKDSKKVTVNDVYNKNITVSYPYETLNEALQKLGQNNIGRMPVVVSDQEKDKLLGLITRKNIIKAYHAEYKRLNNDTAA